MTNVLITGANRGIGFETAYQLAKKGLHVFLTSRNRKAGEVAVSRLVKEKLSAEFIELDITDAASIKQACYAVSSKVPQLNVLINNAAILMDEDENLLTVPQHVVQATFATNVFGHLQVVQQFSALLGRTSRIINISSGGGSMTDSVGGWAPVYCITKSALNAMTRHLAYYLRDKGVVVNAMCPGWVKTDMGGYGATRTPQQGAETAVWLATEAPASFTGKFFRDKKEIPW
jgi:NAD(P)-dependent dehydrogenase (short-subunit alcohol dehydrogenase family)